MIIKGVALDGICSNSVLLTVADIVDHRLGIAKDLGADYTLLSKVGQDEQDTAKTVHSLLDGAPDITVDCSGAEANIRLAVLVRTAQRSSAPYVSPSAFSGSAGFGVLTTETKKFTLTWAVAPSTRLLH
jgi:threonine dehydrogenase-like Zn-dependent dehydrogenase